MDASALYRTIWRWHFYAGLLVIPFVLVLSLSGTIYLFKPQIDRWEERAFQQLPMTGAVSAGQQVEAALAAFPESRLHSYRLPERTGDAALIHLTLADHSMRDVFVSPQGSLLGSLDPESRLIQVVRRIHGQLLLGPRGSWLVELAASWTLVMLVTGMYLWWPRGRGPAGVLWPRRRSLLRDLHAVTAFWMSSFVLVLLLTGLPWADVWGGAFKLVRNEMGWVKGKQDWTVGGRPTGGEHAGGEHAGHDHAAMQNTQTTAGSATTDPSTAKLNAFVTRAAAEQLAFPVLVIPPGAAQRGGSVTASPTWTVKSDTQNRPLRVTITYDAATGALLSREEFSNHHPIDRVVGYGIAWHEGQLFGVINQLLGVLTAVALFVMSITGFLLWRRRRPQGELGAPALPREARKPATVAMVTLLLAAFLPLFALSLLLLWLIDLLLPRISPAAATWLGIVRHASTR
jgi:uncharacterized iron-regulated membrane protein